MVSALMNDKEPSNEEELSESGSSGPGNLTALDSVSRPKDSSEVPGFRLERVLS